MRKLFTLIKIEGRIAIRCIDGVFFGILMPVGIALLIGMICKDKPAFEGAGYTFLESSFAALITVGICATAFMGIPLSVADYRDKKILKHYFATPVSPGMILSVQCIIGLLTAIASAVSVALVMILFFGYRMKGSVGGFVFAYFLVTAAMYGIGMLMASLCRTVKRANLVCTLIYFPMLFLSGATIPYEILPKGIQYAANIMPLTQGIKLLKGYSMGTESVNLMLPLCVMIGIAIVSAAISVKIFKWD